MHEPSALSPETHTHEQGGWEKGGLRGGHGRERKLVQIPEKMFRDLHKGTAVMFSPSVLVVSLENAIKIF